jgi:molecular chaperone GrpE
MSETAKHAPKPEHPADLTETRKPAETPGGLPVSGATSGEQSDLSGCDYEYEIDGDALLADLGFLEDAGESEEISPTAFAPNDPGNPWPQRFRELEKENRKLRLMLERQQQEFENIRLRYERLQETDHQNLRAELMRQVLPLMDNFERAMEHATAGEVNEDFVTGVVLLYKQLSDLLEQNNVIPIMATGELFNPEFHEAVVIEPNSEYEKHTVIAEFEKGYTIGTRLLRPARVKVAIRPE